MNRKGYLISYEGPEGGGKTSQIMNARKWLEGIGLSSVSFREPGGTPIGEDIRDILLNKDYKKEQIMNRLTEALLFQASRSEFVEKIVIPHLEIGDIVLLDRFKDSSKIYQGLVRGLGMETIDFLNDLSTQGIDPDLTLLLDVDPEIGLERRAGADMELNRIDRESIEFHRKIREGYLRIAKEDVSGRWVIVDATPEKEMVENEIKKIIYPRLVERGFIEGNIRRERG